MSTEYKKIWHVKLGSNKPASVYSPVPQTYEAAVLQLLGTNEAKRLGQLAVVKRVA